MALQDMELNTNIEYSIEKFAEKNPLYNGPRPVARAKKADLRSLAMHLPEEKRQQYFQLITDDSIVDSGEELEDGSDTEGYDASDTEDLALE